MGKYDLSICQPALRSDNWIPFYDSICKACTKYSWELVLVSPNDPPKELMDHDNVKFIKEYCNSCKAAMIGSFHCESEIMGMLTDDGVAYPGSLDTAMDLYQGIDQSKDAVLLKFRTRTDRIPGGFEIYPDSYYYAAPHWGPSGVNLDPSWMFLMHYLMPLSRFREIGGYDCQFEHMAVGGGDLAYRLQKDGGKCHISPDEVICQTELLGHTGDHGPIHDSHPRDCALFVQMYTSKGVKVRNRIDFDNYKQCPDIWEQRWTRDEVLKKNEESSYSKTDWS